VRDVGYFNKIYLALESVDFRKQAHGLGLVISQSFKMSTLEGRLLFVFSNKRKNSIRFLYWDETGFAVWSKVLEKAKFKWPKSKESKQTTLTATQLKLLLQGADIAKLKFHEKTNYMTTF
jgi:transposase